MLDKQAQELAMRIREFVETVAPLMLVGIQQKEGTIVEGYITSDQLLTRWFSHCDVQVTSCFYGWCYAKGIDVKDVLNLTLWDAVCIALTGDNLKALEVKAAMEGTADGARITH